MSWTERLVAIVACLLVLAIATGLVLAARPGQPKTLERVCLEQELVQVLLPRAVPTGNGRTRLDYVPTWLMECKRYTTIVRPEGSPP